MIDEVLEISDVLVLDSICNGKHFEELALVGKKTFVFLAHWLKISLLTIK